MWSIYTAEFHASYCIRQKFQLRLAYENFQMYQFLVDIHTARHHLFLLLHMIPIVIAINGFHWHHYALLTTKVPIRLSGPLPGI